MVTCKRCGDKVKVGFSLSWEEGLCPSCVNKPTRAERQKEIANTEDIPTPVRKKSVPTDYYLDIWTEKALRKLDIDGGDIE